MNFRISFSPFLSILVLSFVITACSGSNESGSGDVMSITMYKNPGCECCTKWAQHMEANGFDVTEAPTSTLQTYKIQNNVPYDMAACHTTVIGGYVVEGHVPAEDIKRMLEEQPDAAGIAVPGMPIGSPGMEVAGMENEAYQVYLFQEDGSRQVYAQH